MRRLVLILLLLLMVPAMVMSEEPSLTLPSAASAKEVEAFLLMPKKFAVVNPKRGYVRYIAQNEKRDDMFRVRYWLGGALGSSLDLTLQKRGNITYPDYAGTMCSRAVYSMALSYLGLDITPGDMSAMLHSRNLSSPYDAVTELVGLERVRPERDVFNTMMENYLTDDSYSPIYLYFQRPNGSWHAVLLVAQSPKTNRRYLVVDPNPPKYDGKLCRVYSITLNNTYSHIVSSISNEQIEGSKILQIYQWRLLDPQEVQAETP